MNSIANLAEPLFPTAPWQVAAYAVAFVVVAGIIGLVMWARRSALSPVEAATELRTLGVELIRLPGRLRQVANDPRTPRRARWWLIGLAVYVASPIDPIPDFLPVIGYMDELVVVPLVLRHIKRMDPPVVWAEHFPARPNSN